MVTKLNDRDTDLIRDVTSEELSKKKYVSVCNGCGGLDDVNTEWLIKTTEAVCEAAKCFRPGDAKLINDLLEDWVYSEDSPQVEMLERLKKAAEILEGI